MRFVSFLGCVILMSACSAPSSSSSSTTSFVTSEADGGTSIKTVFVILMENHNWSDIKGSSKAPYINGPLMAMAAHTEAYMNPPHLHPSLPNYLWLEAGANFGILNDDEPNKNHQSSTAHLVTQLTAAGISWKAYAEDIDGKTCPLQGSGLYAPKHTPMAYFDDVTDKNSPTSRGCIEHIRPYTELAQDLANHNVARYVFITPNLCNDMHGVFLKCGSTPAGGDQWLSRQIPMIMASDAYKSGGAIFLTWDEGEGSDGPIGMFVVSPFAKAGYSNKIPYTHSSTLRTFQEIFGVGPFLGDAANANDLSDLFTQFP